MSGTSRDKRPRRPLFTLQLTPVHARLLFHGLELAERGLLQSTTSADRQDAQSDAFQTALLRAELIGAFERQGFVLAESAPRRRRRSGWR